MQGLAFGREVIAKYKQPLDLLDINLLTKENVDSFTFGDPIVPLHDLLSGKISVREMQKDLIAKIREDKKLFGEQK